LLESHFDHVLKPFADALNVDVITFASLYQSGEILESRLDEYFLHDRAGIKISERMT
jgi:alpha,alpha-trehalase